MGDEDSTFNLQTPAAKVAPKVQYTNLLFQTFYKCADVCGSSEIAPEYIQKKVEFLAKLIINFIPNPDERVRLKEMRASAITELKKQKNNGNIDVDEYNDLVLDVNTDIIGEVMTLCDDFLAIVERQYVMPMLPADKKKELEEKFYGADGKPKRKENVSEEIENAFSEI
jgi:hypothetical protein